MGVKLYGHPMSSCTVRVMACLYEKGVEFELVPINMFAGEQKTPDFLAKNVQKRRRFFIDPLLCCCLACPLSGSFLFIIALLLL